MAGLDVCYKCGKPGHVAKTCKTLLNEFPNWQEGEGSTTYPREVKWQPVRGNIFADMVYANQKREAKSFLIKMDI